MFTPSQERALEKMLSGESVYLSGAAGVGKSYLLNEFINRSRENGKGVMVTAPTGVAALNVNGSTIHSALGWPKLGKDVRASEILIETDILVVDEISMCRIDLFDHIAKKLDAANIERVRKGREEIQLVCVGDFAQLPPVVRDDDKKILDAFFPGTSGYAFEHPKWTLPTIQLTEVVRQRNSAFAESLNQIRLGDAQGLDYINNQRNKKKIKDGIWVLATNKKVQAKNREELAKLNAKHKTYNAVTTGDCEEPTDKHLTLANGCRVVSLINQNGYSNGSLGTVVECGDGCVSVAFDNGVVADIGPHKWETKKPTLIEKEDGSKHLSEEVIGSFEQLPLKLAYAVTIHKSQGQTYDKMNADPYCFAPGQLYVELSRAQDVGNLYLTREIVPKDIKADPKVVEFYAGSDPVTVADVAFSIDDEKDQDKKIVLESSVTVVEEDQERDNILVTADNPTKEKDAVEPKKRGRKRKVNDTKEVASDTITARVTPTTKEEYERVLDSMEGDSKTEKFRNLVKAVGEADAITSKTGSDREDYENFLLYTTRLAESYSELLKQKSELADKIRLDYQDQLASKDTTISDLQSKVAEKDDQIRSAIEDQKDLMDQIKSLEVIAHEVDTSREKAVSAEESLKDSRMICATLQERIAKLETETEGFDDLKTERDDLERDNNRLSERLKENSVEIEEYKKKIADLESKYEGEKTKYEAEKDARKQDQAEHMAELARASIDAVKDKEAAIKEARADERQYWQEQIKLIQDKLDQEREKHDKERKELDNFKIAELEKQIATLTEEKD